MKIKASIFFFVYTIFAVADDSHVCVKRIIDVQRVPITYLDSYKEISFSDDCTYFPCSVVKIKTRLAEKVITKTSLKYDKYCCEGYVAIEQNYTTTSGVIHCEPKCDQNCTNGYCIKPNVCKCYDGYKLTFDLINNCAPICDPGCGNGSCIAPNICLCDPGYTYTSSGCKHVPAPHPSSQQTYSTIDWRNSMPSRSSSAAKHPKTNKQSIATTVFTIGAVEEFKQTSSRNLMETSITAMTITPAFNSSTSKEPTYIDLQFPKHTVKLNNSESEFTNETVNLTNTELKDAVKGLTNSWLEQPWGISLLALLLIIMAAIALFVLWHQTPVGTYLRGRFYHINGESTPNGTHAEVRYAKTAHDV